MEKNTMGGAEKFRKGYMHSLKVRHQSIREAFERFPREEFIPPEFSQLKEEARLDRRLAFNESYAMPEPTVVAKMLQGLRLTGAEKVLEVGAGTGFMTAMLSMMAKKVYSFEKNEYLFGFASQMLEQKDIRNVQLFWGDGGDTHGDRQYDAIVVEAASNTIPNKFVRQLKMGGRIVMPIGKLDQQCLVIGIKKEGGLEETRTDKVHFLPLAGGQGHDFMAGQNPYRTQFRPHGEKKRPK